MAAFQDFHKTNEIFVLLSNTLNKKSPIKLTQKNFNSLYNSKYKLMTITEIKQIIKI